MMKLPSWKSISPRRRKLALWSVGLLAFYAVIGFFILPPILRRVAVKQLSQQLDREVTIEKIKINPFTLTAKVRGLLIKDPDQEPFVSWDEVHVNFQISSLFTRAWSFKEIRLSKPFVRVRVNWDNSFNFSDLITKFSSTNTGPASPQPAAKPLVLHIGRIQLAGVTAAFADFTTRETFRRTLGPLDIHLEDFSTDPDNQNPYAFTGTTDAGERISWKGFFSLAPLRSEGELTLDHFSLNKYAALYQDFVRFEIRDGSIGLHANYRFELSATNRVAVVSDSAFALRDLKLRAPGDSNDFVVLPHFAITGVGVDLQRHEAVVDALTALGGDVRLRRNSDATFNVVENSKPTEVAAHAPGGILFLLHTVTNVVAQLLDGPDQWRGTLRQVDITNCALHFEDLVNSRPATLALTEIRLVAKNVSNIPGTNFTSDFSLRWNTNGSFRSFTTATFLPPTFDIQIDLDQLDLGSLDAYLEPQLNLFILGSKLGLHGKINLLTPRGELPQVTFRGDARLDDFQTVDGVAGEDLLKWDSLRFNGLEANLNPPVVGIREIILDQAYARLVIETNRTINLLNALRLTDAAATTNPAAVTVKPAAATNSTAVKIAIGVVVITNTAVSFTDRSLTPDVNLALQQLNGNISGISSDELQHAVVALSAKVDGTGPVAITGTINPLNGAATNTIKISVQDVDLTPASAYAAKFAGYRIAQGKLNLELAYDLVGKNLSAKNVITLTRFSFGEKVDSPDATSLPVRLAVAILKDREGKIILDVPVEGSTDDPQFHIGKVIARTLVNILVKVAASPFSVLGAAFGGGEELGWQDFAAGSAELSAADKAKLDELLKALYERPALELEISGSIDPDGDREGLQRVALDLEIRKKIWMKLRQSEQATNSVEQLALAPDDRARWIKKFYDQALAAKIITPELIAANTNLAAFVASVPSRNPRMARGAGPVMMKPAEKNSALAATTYVTKLVPPPDATEAMLLATFPVGDGDLEKLAAARSKAVQDYLLQSGQVEAARLFLTAKDGALRRAGSRAYLQFR